ncbi:MAG TPA: MFS transporter [Patescibacteria group bacterium]|nr:MFS transporter [Patescibacteria group bacterium]
MIKLLRSNRSLLIISLIAMVNALGYGIVIPLLYSYSLKFGLNDFQNGLLFALFSVCQFISTPVIGRLSDRFGRKPLLVISVAGTALSFFTMAFAPNTFFLFVARALDGITAGNFPVATAVIADSIDEKDRARGFGIISAAFGFGFLFGPAISALTVGGSESVPFVIAGFITLIAVAVTAIYLPETNKHMGEVAHSGKMFDFVKMAKSAFDPNVGATLLITLVYFLSFTMFYFGFQPFTVKVLHLTPQQISLLFALFGGLGFITQMFLVQRVVKALSLKKALIWGFSIIAIVFIISYFIKSLIPFLVVTVIMGIISSLVQPLIATVLSSETDAKSQGTIFGLNSSFMSVGQIIGPVIGGGISEANPANPFLGAGIITLLCVYLSTKILKGGKKDSAF